LKRQELAKKIGLGRKPQIAAALDPVATTCTRSQGESRLSGDKATQAYFTRTCSKIVRSA